MDMLNENKKIDIPKEGELLPVVALGTTAIRVAQALNEKNGGLEIYGISDINIADEAVDGVPEFMFTVNRPIRFLLYDRAEAGCRTVKAFAAKAKSGGKLFTFEISTRGEKMQPSWRIGTDVLVRVKDKEQCLAASDAMLHMLASQISVGLDADDVLALFDGTDVVHIGIGTAESAQAISVAVNDALLQIGWKPEFLRGILISLSGGENLSMKEMDAATASVMNRVSQDCNIVFSAEVDPALGDGIRITLLATCGKRKDSHDASEWMMGMLEEKFSDEGNE